MSPPPGLPPDPRTCRAARRPAAGADTQARTRGAALGAALVAACGAAPSPLARAPERSPRSAPVAALSVSAPTTAPTEPRVPPSPTARPREGPFGAPVPTLLVASSPSREWAVTCEARADTDGDGTLSVGLPVRGTATGDTLAAFAYLDAGAGDPIDELLAHDRRWLVVRRGSAYELWDARSGARVDLGDDVDTRDDVAPRRSHRAFALSASPDGESRWLALVRRHAGSVRVALRDLTTGEERGLAHGAGEPWRLQFDAAERGLWVEAATTDGDGDGRVEWPVGERSAPRAPCEAPRAPYVATAGGDPALAVYVPLDGGAARGVPGLVTPLTLGGRWLVRDVRGGLALVDGTATTPLLPESCSGRLLHADPTNGELVVSCRGERGKLGVELLVGGERIALPLTLGAAPGDATIRTRERWVPLTAGQETVLIDLDARAARPLPHGATVVHVVGKRALLLRGAALELLSGEDAASRATPSTPTGDGAPPEPSGAPAGAQGRPAGSAATLSDGAPTASTLVPAGVEHVTGWLTAGAFAAVGPFVVDAALGVVVGRIERECLALSLDGRCLTPTAEGDIDHPPRGPLTWQEPTP